jgi:hypothetical protein
VLLLPRRAEAFIEVVWALGAPVDTVRMLERLPWSATCSTMRSPVWGS